MRGPTQNSLRKTRAGSGHQVAGLYHYGARYYNPTTARWTQPDPLDQIGDLRQANRYSYAGGDPVSLTDPFGTSFIDDAIDLGKVAVQ